MEVILSKYCDFCNGVKRTIRICNRVLNEYESIYSIGQVIHNPQVTKLLEEKGLRVIRKISQVPSDSYLLIRSHGISLATIKEAKARKIKLIDAACPFVKYIQKICKRLKAKGYFVIITGDAGHPEVKALKDIAGDKSIIIHSRATKISLPKEDKKIGIISQSTYTKAGFYSIISKALNLDLAEVRIFNTICKDSLNRRAEVKKIASIADAVFIIGGKNSANTKRLHQVSKRVNSCSYHIENPVEVRRFFNSINNVNRIGIIGGASTPKWIIDEFLRKIPKCYNMLPIE